MNGITHPFALKLTSHNILHYLWSADLLKSFSQLFMSIFIFSQYFFSIEKRKSGKVRGYPTWLISRFINFKINLKRKSFSR